jgi:tRNA(fMet)-specific endonuclease VapC
MMLLVDSSIWIDFLRNKDGEHAALTIALREGSALICPVVWVEICSGIRGKREELICQHIKDLCPSLEMDAEVWSTAVALGRTARQSGLNCPLADILIAACARRHGVGLMHRDKHLAILETLSI